MTDLTSSGNANCHAFSFCSRIVYFEVSSLAICGSLVSFKRRSHFTFMLPSKPGSKRRTG